MSDEVLPVIFDGAPISEEGLLDAFARHYPKRAFSLFQLMSKGGKLGQGYRFVFCDDPIIDEIIAAKCAEMKSKLAKSKRAEEAEFEKKLEALRIDTDDLKNIEPSQNVPDSLHEVLGPFVIDAL